MLYIDDWLWALLVYVSSWVGLISILTYLLSIAIQQVALRVPQNLKKKYNAQWALVTGASSGIGKSIAEKLASQGINVVLVALDDPLLGTTFTELQQKYRDCTFRKIGVNLGDSGMKYMDPIIDGTKDIDVNLVFNNAGYLLGGLFAETELDRLRMNLECNAGCSVPITHHFMRRMIQKKQKGLITFTSSASCYLPGPTATLYSPTKAFLTNFAASVASEVKDIGIDVVVIHPSPVNTNFYKNQGSSLDSLKQAQKAAAPPDNIANQIFAAAGRLTLWDQGTTCAVFRIVNKLLDIQIFYEIIVRFAWLNGDHKKLASESKLRTNKAQ